MAESYEDVGNRPTGVQDPTDSSDRSVPELMRQLSDQTLKQAGTLAATLFHQRSNRCATKKAWNRDRASRFPPAEAAG